MPTLAEQIVSLLKHSPGLTDREITDTLRTHSDNQQPINQKCHDLEHRGIISRRRRSDGLIGNYLASSPVIPVANHAEPPVHKPTRDGLSEDEVKRFLEKWLITEGWQVQVAWGKAPGADIVARKGAARWVIEVKGCGSRSEMRVNYFLSALGELLQRMDKADSSYSIAFPDMQQFRRLWARLPSLAKDRIGLTALLVETDGNVVRL